MLAPRGTRGVSRRISPAWAEHRRVLLALLVVAVTDVDRMPILKAKCHSIVFVDTDCESTFGLSLQWLITASSMRSTVAEAYHLA